MWHAGLIIITALTDCNVIDAVLEQLGLESESYSTSLPRNFPPSRDMAMGDRPMVCTMTDYYCIY